MSLIHLNEQETQTKLLFVSKHLSHKELHAIRSSEWILNILNIISKSKDLRRKTQTKLITNLCANWKTGVCWNSACFYTSGEFIIDWL